MSKRSLPAHDDLLTPAQWRVVEAVRHGMSNRDIAARRGISISALTRQSKSEVRDKSTKPGQMTPR